MSTVNLALQATETTSKTRRSLLSAVATLADVDELALQKVKLDVSEEHTVTFERLFACSVNIKILIQIQVGSDVIEREIDSCMVLPFGATVKFINPADNPIAIPAVVSYVAV